MTDNMDAIKETRMRILTSLFMSLLLLLTWGCEHRDDNTDSATNAAGSAVTATADQQDAVASHGVSSSDLAAVAAQHPTYQPQNVSTNPSADQFTWTEEEGSETTILIAFTNMLQFVPDNPPVTNNTPSVTTNGIGISNP